MKKTDRAKILIVDDEANIRHLLRLTFEGDFDVVEAGDGQEAVRIALKERPDIIVSDIMMPKLDGYGLYRKLKNRPETSLVPFIFLSAKKDVDERVVGLEMGADDYITKPFSIKELKAKVKSISRKVVEMRSRGSLEGMLREVDLVDVIQLMEMGRKTGMLVLETPELAGRIYLRQGAPIYAQAGRWTGLEAFFTMLTLKEGHFRLEQKPLDVPENLPNYGGQELLMEGVRLCDEMSEALRSLPHEKTVLVPGRGNPKASGELMAVRTAFDGGATVRQACTRSDLPPYRFYPLAVRATNEGLLTNETESARKLQLLRVLKEKIDAV